MGVKKDDAPPTVVFKLDLHCYGCTNKIEKAVRRLPGVENVKVDMAANKLTVIGKVDTAKVRDELAGMIHHKKVEIVSPQPKKDAGADRKPGEKSDKKDGKKDQDKKPKESTVVRVQKIREVTLKIKEVEWVKMDVKEITPYLEGKPNRNVEVVPPKKDHDKKDKGKAKPAGDGGKKKDVGQRLKLTR